MASSNITEAKEEEEDESDDSVVLASIPEISLHTTETNDDDGTNDEDENDNDGFLATKIPSFKF
jgi:hypothetical protein